jgi:hypothetical protein
MKTNSHTKSVHPVAQPAVQRAGGIRPSVARTLERRYERRKFREQLRRLDWALNMDDDSIG